MRRILCLALTVAASSAWADLAYTLTPEPANRSVRVALELEAPAGPVRFRIPAWCPGFYTLKRYQDKISDVRIVDAKGTAYAVERFDGRGWSVQHSGGALTLSYRVLGDDPGLGFFGVTAKPTTTFVNGPAAFMFPEGRLKERCTLKIDVPQDWQIATGMGHEDGRYVSADYDEFIDHPLQLGAMERRSFKVHNVPFEAVYVTDDGRYPNLDASVAELKALSEPAMRMFGSAPFKRYVYIVHLAVGNFGGGLEHRASTVLAVPNAKNLELGSLAAHEFFHAWNVKQIRPKVLGPFDYTRAVRTGNLWFAEGVTDYYANLHTYEAGRYSLSDLLAVLSDEIATLQSSQSRRVKSLEAACRDTWENGGFGYGDMSYYNKGLLAGLIFDAAIRHATEGAKSLDDVLRYLDGRHRLPNPGFEEDDLRKAINAVAMQDLSALYERVVRSTEELPYEGLREIGLEVQATRNAWELRPIDQPNERQLKLFRGWARLAPPTSG